MSTSSMLFARIRAAGAEPVSAKTLTVLGIVSLLFAEVFLLQWLGGAYGSGFGGHPDEAAHFVSSLMVRDFLPQLGSAHPMAFAQSYYLHFPKVAIGNWPPLLYGVAGAWFLLFGASRASALVFIAILVGATACAVYAIGRKLVSPSAGLFAAALFVAFPLVQESSAMMMAEPLVTLLILLSTLQFARFAETGTTRDAMLFGALSTLAILTRGSAWSLLFVPPITIALTRRWSLLANWRLWLSAVPVALCCVPWYLWAKGMSNGAMSGIDPHAPTAFFTDAMTKFPLFVARAAGPVPVALFVLGGAVLALRKARLPHYWASLFAALAGVLLLQSIVPASIEQRFMVQLLPSFVLIAAAGAGWLIGRIPANLAAPAWTAVAAAVLLSMSGSPDRIRNSGYEAVSSVLMGGVRSERGPAILLASDPVGEGSVIAAIAAARPGEQPVCLRASKILVSEDWLGRHSRSRFPAPADLRKLLDALPVEAVMIDDALVKEWRRPYHKQLAELMRADPRTWRSGGAYHVIRNGKPSPGLVSVYFRQRPGQARPATDMRLVDKLMRPD